MQIHPIFMNWLASQLTPQKKKVNSFSELLLLKDLNNKQQSYTKRIKSSGATLIAYALYKKHNLNI